MDIHSEKEKGGGGGGGGISGVLSQQKKRGRASNLARPVFEFMTSGAHHRSSLFHHTPASPNLPRSHLYLCQARPMA